MDRPRVECSDKLKVSRRGAGHERWSVRERSIMHFSRSEIICFLILSGVGGCSKEGSTSVAPQSIQVGGLYATQDKDGTWRVMKVLALDEHAVHLRSYANKFRERPTDLDPATLRLGGLNDPAGFGIG